MLSDPLRFQLCRAFKYVSIKRRVTSLYKGQMCKQELRYTKEHKNCKYFQFHGIIFREQNLYKTIYLQIF